MWLWLTLVTDYAFSAVSQIPMKGFSWCHCLCIQSLVANEEHFTWRTKYNNAVSRLPIEGISCNFILLIFDAYTPNDVILVARSRKWRALYWKNEVPFPLSLSFRWNFITLHGYHECARTSVGLVTALYFEDQLPFRLYLGFHWRDFPETAYLTLPSRALKPW